eukprot:s2373_g7.t1
MVASAEWFRVGKCRQIFLEGILEGVLLAHDLLGSDICFGSYPEQDQCLLDGFKGVGLLMAAMAAFADRDGATARGQVSVPDWALAIKLSKEQLGALERRTHVDVPPYDYMVPPVFSDETIQDQVHRGPGPPGSAPPRGGDHRPVLGLWTLWQVAKRDPHLDAALVKEIYAAWHQMPITLTAHKRGRDHPDSKTAKRVLDWNLARKEAKAFVAAVGRSGTCSPTRRAASWPNVHDQLPGPGDGDAHPQPARQQGGAAVPGNL